MVATNGTDHLHDVRCLCAGGVLAAAERLLCWRLFVRGFPERTAPQRCRGGKTQKQLKSRRLKKADFEVDFFFIDDSGVVSLGGEPEKVVAILGEMLDACQYFSKRVSFAGTGGGGVASQMPGGDAAVGPTRSTLHLLA